MSAAPASDLQIVVHLTDARRDRLKAGEALIAHDDHASTVRRFFEQNHLPYSEVFVSLTAYVGTIPTSAPSRAYQDGAGAVAVLNIDRILSDIAIICTHDVQNTAVNALKKTKAQQRSYLQRFKRPEPLDKRVAQIRRLAQLVGSDGRLELRLYRPLTLDDVVALR